MKAKDHYDQHLADFYAWMVGDIQPKIAAFKTLLIDNGIQPVITKTALDLGAGHGIQSIAMSEAGYAVTAIDFNQKLLDELDAHPSGSGIETVLGDIKNVSEFSHVEPELLVCCGDTLTHLDNMTEVKQFVKDTVDTLRKEGHLILTFRDYSQELGDELRFIPVKSDENRILTCVLEYTANKVRVTDLLQERKNGHWVQKVSTYEKVRLAPENVVNLLKEQGLSIRVGKPIDRMFTIIAQKH